MLLYDNLEDTMSKLHGTIVYYGGLAALVREVNPDDVEQKLPYLLTLQTKGRNYITCPINDPKFSYKDYNLGYANHGSAASWWYRKPMKQYRQGLRADQMNSIFSRPNIYGRARWEFSNSIIQMLENNYPKIDTCERNLKEGEVEVMAFHRDLAMSYDRIHKDFIIEYRGKIAGQTNNLKDFSLLDEYKYLTEAIKEAMK